MKNRKLYTAVLAAAAAAMILMNGCGGDKDKAAETTAAQTTAEVTAEAQTAAETKAAETKAAETKAAEQTEDADKAEETGAEAGEAGKEADGGDQAGAAEETAAEGDVVGPGAGLESPVIEETEEEDYGEEEDDEYSGEPNPSGKVKSIRKNHSGNLVKPEGGAEERTPD